MDEDALKPANTDRRTAKSAFTRVGKSLVYTVKHERPPDEVRQALAKLQSASSRGISSMQSVTPSEERTVEPRYNEVPLYRKKNARYSGVYEHPAI